MYAGSAWTKNSEVEAQSRQIKGWVVGLGNHVVDQYHDAATFQDMGSLLATLEAVEAVDFHGCLPRHVIEVVDGEQAYVQAEDEWKPTWCVCHQSNSQHGGRIHIRTCGS